MPENSDADETGRKNFASISKTKIKNYRSIIGKLRKKKKKKKLEEKG